MHRFINNFFSFAPSKYKNGLIKTLLDICYKIKITWKGFDNDLENLKNSSSRASFHLNLSSVLTEGL